MASLLRAAFEDSLAAFVIRKNCKLPYSKSWDEVKIEKLWEVAKDHPKLQDAAAQTFVTAIEAPDNMPILFVDLEPDTLKSINWNVFHSLLNTLEAVAPDMAYSFQTKLDRLSK